MRVHMEVLDLSPETVADIFSQGIHVRQPQRAELVASLKICIRFAKPEKVISDLGGVLRDNPAGRMLPFKEKPSLDKTKQKEQSGKEAVKSEKEKREKSRRKGWTCHKCGEEDHMASDCKRKASVCYSCKKEGHVSKDCPVHSSNSV